jgi:SNF2 family DNA or RNA helicase
MLRELGIEVRGEIKSREKLPSPTEAEYQDSGLMRLAIEEGVEKFLKDPEKGIAAQNIHGDKYSHAHFYVRDEKGVKVKEFTGVTLLTKRRKGKTAEEVVVLFRELGIEVRGEVKRRDKLPNPTEAEYQNDGLMRRAIGEGVNKFLKDPEKGITADNIHYAKYATAHFYIKDENGVEAKVFTGETLLWKREKRINIEGIIDLLRDVVIEVRGEVKKREKLPNPTEAEYQDNGLMRRAIEGGITKFLKDPDKGMTAENIRINKFSLARYYIKDDKGVEVKEFVGATLFIKRKKAITVEGLIAMLRELGIEIDDAQEKIEKEITELSKYVDEGNYRKLLENLPIDLRIDFLLMLYSKKFGDDVIAEFAARLARENARLGANINSDSVVKESRVSKLESDASEETENQKSTRVVSGVDGKHPLATGKGKLDKLESALAIGAFNQVEFKVILTIIRAKYLHELLTEFKFDIPAALAYARNKLAELKDRKTLLYSALGDAIQQLDRRFTFRGLAFGFALKAHQLLGIRFLLDHMVALLGDEMGSGKTLQALLTAINAGCKKVLIICRNNGRKVWLDEIENKIDPKEDRSRRIIRSRRDLEKSKRDRFIIVNYEWARGHVEELQKLNPDMIILDEAHALCHEDSQQSSKIRDLKAERKIAVSGTPLLNESKELWPILHFLLPEEFPSSEAFEQNYTLNLYQRALLNNRLREIMLRRKMEEYSVQLPPIIEEAIEVPMTPKQEEVYHQITDDPVRWAFDHKIRFSRLRLISWLIQAADDIGMLLIGKLAEIGEGGKYNKVREIISAAPEKRRIIFARNQAVMKHLSSILPDAAEITQKTPHDRRDEIIKEYKSGKLKTIIMSYQLGGESYNLPETDDIILFDQAWNTPQKQQAIYRAYRLNRAIDRPLRVTSLLSEESIDKDIVSMQKGKWQEFREVVEGVKDKRHLNEEKIERLLQMSQRRRVAQMIRDEYLDEMPEKLKTAEFIQALGRGDFDFIARYYKEHLFELRAFWDAVARIGMMRELGIPAWRDELTLGAGPSTLYEAWQKLKTKRILSAVPTVVDIDQSPEMNRVAANPNKHLLSMTRLGEIPGEFDMIGAEFSFYYVDPLDRADVIRQAWKKLRENGHLVLSGPKMVFEQEAIEAIEKLGFSVMTKPGELVESSKMLFDLAKAMGKTPAEAASLIKNTGILIARKTSEPPAEGEVYIPITRLKKEEKKEEILEDKNGPIPPITSPEIDRIGRPEKVAPLPAFRQDLHRLTEAELIAELGAKINGLELSPEERAGKEEFIVAAKRFLENQQTLPLKEKADVIKHLIELSYKLFPVPAESFRALIEMHGSLSSVPEAELRELGLVKEEKLIRSIVTIIYTPMLAHYFREILSCLAKGRNKKGD